MKTNKILGLALLFSAISVGVVSAQKEQKSVNNPQERIAKHADRMKTELNLTDEQTAKMKNIEMSVQKDREQMQKSMQDARKDFMSKMKGHEAEMQKILTPEQFQKYQAKMQRMKGRMEGYKMGMRDAHKMGRPAMRPGMNGNDKKHRAPSDVQPTDKDMQSQK
jgi:Spy/CpxP family protein refolding chaperone